MRHSLTLNPTRLGQLISNDIRIHSKRILIAIVAIIAILSLFAFFSLTDSSGNDMTDFHYWLYPLTFIAFGILLTGSMFKEMGYVHERQHYLSLPASNLEKFSARWILMVIAYPIVFTLLYFFFSIIFQMIAKNYTTVEIWDFNPFSFNVYIFFRVFLCVQSLFILGAIFFRKYTSIKTVATLFSIAITTAFIVLLLFRIVMAPYFDGWSFNDLDVNIQPSQSFQNFMTTKGIWLLEAMFYYVMPVYLWIVSYIKFTEQEV